MTTDVTRTCFFESSELVLHQQCVGRYWNAAGATGGVRYVVCSATTDGASCAVDPRSPPTATLPLRRDGAPSRAPISTHPTLEHVTDVI